MEKAHVEVNRDTITGYINKLCKGAGVTRESLGILQAQGLSCILMVPGPVLVLVESVSLQREELILCV